MTVRHSRSLILGVLLLSLAACASKKPTYQPSTPDESRFFQKADRRLTPNDVMGDIAQYQKTNVAWAGIVIARKVTQSKKNDFEVNLLLEHRNYDWNQNVTPKANETFVVSSQSGGKIRILGKYSRPKGSKLIPGQELSPGTLVILYGTPERVEKGGIVVLNSGYLRPIEKKFYSSK